MLFLLTLQTWCQERLAAAYCANVIGFGVLQGGFVPFPTPFCPAGLGQALPSWGCSVHTLMRRAWACVFSLVPDPLVCWDLNESPGYGDLECCPLPRIRPLTAPPEGLQQKPRLLTSRSPAWHWQRLGIHAVDKARPTGRCCLSLCPPSCLKRSGQPPVKQSA